MVHFNPLQCKCKQALDLFLPFEEPNTPSLPALNNTYSCLAYSISFADDAGCGGVYSTADIADDEAFLLIPYEPLVLTDALARQHLPASISSSVDCRTALILYLIQQRLLGDSSFFQPYLDMVPERIYTALEFDEEDLEHLRGTNAFLTVKDLKRELREKYEETMEMASEVELPEEDYTWEMFLWAETVVSSRAFPAHLFGECKEGELVLIPLAGNEFSFFGCVCVCVEEEVAGLVTSRHRDIDRIEGNFML